MLKYILLTICCLIQIPSLFAQSKKKKNTSISYKKPNLRLKKSDLKIISFTTNKTKLIEKETYINAKIKVSNTGNLDSKPFEISIHMGSKSSTKPSNKILSSTSYLSGYKFKGGSTYCTPLKKGQSKIYTIRFAMPKNYGTLCKTKSIYAIAYVDLKNKNPELNEKNNKKTVRLGLSCKPTIRRTDPKTSTTRIRTSRKKPQITTINSSKKPIGTTTSSSTKINRKKPRFTNNNRTKKPSGNSSTSITKRPANNSKITSTSTNRKKPQLTTRNNSKKPTNSTSTSKTKFKVKKTGDIQYWQNNNKAK